MTFSNGGTIKQKAIARAQNHVDLSTRKLNDKHIYHGISLHSVGFELFKKLLLVALGIWLSIYNKNSVWVKGIDGWSNRLLRRSQDLPKEQLPKEVCSKELLMQDKMTVGNKWQQYVSAEMQKGVYDECISGVSQSMMELLLRLSCILFYRAWSDVIKITWKMFLTMAPFSTSHDIAYWWV